MSRFTCLIVITASILSGCAKEYVYTPPKSEAGIACVSHCQERQAICRDRALSEADAKKSQCERTANREYKQCTFEAEQTFASCQETAKTDYYACLKYAQKRDTCRESACVKNTCSKQSCYRHVSYTQCDSEFRDCYQQCGGRIDEAK
jgi:hypothetical protein